MPIPPPPHPSGARPPDVPADLVPRHVAIVMDGNGRWANARGLPRTAGHQAGEAALLDVVAGAIEIGVTHISAYAFSTENWKRSPEEVRFLMGFNRDVLRRRRDTMHEWGVRVRWAGRRPRLWRSVITELETAEALTRHNTVCTLTMCVNYGGRAEIADAAKAIAREVAEGRLDPERVDVGGAAHVELHDLAGRVRRAGLPGRVLARRRPSHPVARRADLCQSGPPVRRGGRPLRDLTSSSSGVRVGVRR